MYIYSKEYFSAFEMVINGIIELMVYHNFGIISLVGVDCNESINSMNAN